MTTQPSLKPFLEEHLPMLAGWLDAPHVAPWFPNRQEYLDFARAPPAGGEQRIIAVDGREVGYLRWVVLGRDSLDNAGFLELPVGTVDADLLLGDADVRGQGVGVRVLEDLAVDMQERGAPLLALTTSVNNSAAQRAFEKAGFRRYCEYAPEPFGPCYLMVRDLPVG